MASICVAAFYKFVELDDCVDLQPKLLKKCMDYDIKGTLLLAKEGINGTLSGSDISINNILKCIRSDPRLHDLVHKTSYSDREPFLRLKVRLKKEIVTMGIPELDPRKMVGTYVKPQSWNNMISDPNVIVVDTRNQYEVGIGTFPSSVNPKLTSFRDFPDWVEKNINLLKNKKIAMFCTGGIRCEKSTAYLKARGFGDVYHLEGGILSYLEQVSKTDNLWEGECFVFDDRVSVDHDLKVGKYDMCHACRNPISEFEKESEFYKPGVSCPKCIAVKSLSQKERYAERQKQMDLAKKRNQVHLGDKASFEPNRSG